MLTKPRLIIDAYASTCEFAFQCNDGFQTLNIISMSMRIALVSFYPASTWCWMQKNVKLDVNDTKYLFFGLL